jgi:TolB-like protein
MGSVSPGAGREFTTWCGLGEMPTPDSVRNQLNKVLDSATFRSSPALRRFLRYTVEHSVQGEGECLKEYRLGVEVFGRSSSYEPQKDPIVRLEARRLRAKLREYYEEEGSQDPVRISIPKGGYAASFSGNGHGELSAPFPASEISPLAEKERFPSGKAKILLALSVCIVTVLLIGVVVYRYGARRNDTIQTTSIAVLPFQNLSEDTAQDYLADGITESLIDSLSSFPTLRVLARSTVFHYKGENSDPQKVGSELHVSAVLTGRLLERNQILIVQTELIDVATGALLWDTQYNRKLTEIHTLQEDISRDVSRHLRLHLIGQQINPP